MSLLTIVQSAARDVGFDVPPTVVANTRDVTAQQMWALANRVGTELALKPYQELIKEGSISISAGVPDYALETDFGVPLDETMWNRTSDRPVFSSLSEREWSDIKGIESVSTINMRARIRDNKIWFADTISADQAGQEIYYGYITKHWVLSSASAGQTAFLADTDTAKINEELITLGVIAFFLRRKGWPHDLEMAQYLNRSGKLLGNAQFASTIHSKTPTRTTKEQILANMPDTGYG